MEEEERLKEEESSGRPTNAFLREAALVFAAVPASLSFVSTLDQFKFVPWLERIVLKFSKLSDHFWQLVAESFPILSRVDHLLLSFLLLLIGSTTIDFSMRVYKAGGLNLLGHHSHQTIRPWGIASQTALCILGALFGLGDAVTMGLWIGALISVGAVLWSVTFGTRRNWIYFDTKKRCEAIFVVASIAILGLSLLYISGFIIFPDFLKYYSTRSTLLFGFAMTISVWLMLKYIASNNVRGPAYILLVSSGIILANWFNVTVVPLAEDFLRRAGV